MLIKMETSGGGGGTRAAKGVIKAADWNGTAQSSTVSVTGLGFKPSSVSVFGTSTNRCVYAYDERFSTENFSGAQSATAVNFKPMSTNTYTGQLYSIDNDGFTLIYYRSSYTDSDIYWVAVE